MIVIPCDASTPLRFTFEETTEGWVGIPPPTGSETSISLSDESTASDKHALKIDYQVEAGRLAGITHAISGLTGNGITTRLKTDTPTTIVLGLAETDGSVYMHAMQTQTAEWLTNTIPYSFFTLSDDSKDENSSLDLDQVVTIIIADASGFMPNPGMHRTLLIDEYASISDFPMKKLKPYQPLLRTGLPTKTGARATVGVSYRPGKFGIGLLTDAPGELVAVPINSLVNPPTDWRWIDGTIEFWLSPQFDMSQVRDYTGLVSMQDEPFFTGMRGSLQVIYTKTQQIGFLINSQMDNTLGTPQLNWKSGEWHHLAVSWGKLGMHLYIDGKLISQNEYAGCPGMFSGDIVIGNQAWTLMSNQYANTVIDELRFSKKQRSDAEILASAKASKPMTADLNTIALERFDGRPYPPIYIKPGKEPFNAIKTGKNPQINVIVPGDTGKQCKLNYIITTPIGKVISSGISSVPISTKNHSGYLERKCSLKVFTIPGFYQISFQLTNGTLLINQGVDWIRVLPASTQPQSSMLFGASGCYSDIKDPGSYFKHAKATGVTTYRLPFEWGEIEPREGEFVWQKYDQIVESANQYGVELIPTFIWEKPKPSWAGKTTVKVGQEEYNYPPEDMEKWSKFVYEVVNRYKGKVRWWIPANEPNLPKYWGPKPDPKAYVALLKVAHDTILKADLSAKILGCSVSGIDLDFLEACFKEGALNYCDAIGMHPYICPRSPDERIPVNILNPASPIGNFHDGLGYAKALIEKYGGKQKIWMDEAGQPYRDDFPIAGWGVSEPKAAEHLVKIFLEAAASGAVDRILWFSFFGGEYGSFALLKPDGSPTLPMVAYTATAEKISGAKYTGEAKRGDNIRGLRFESASKVIDAVWNIGKPEVIPMLKNETAFDMYGFPITEANSSRHLKSTEQPVYLISSKD
ncbi:MAG: LamG domain-containing protein [Armatimonadota bacterium]